MATIMIATAFVFCYLVACAIKTDSYENKSKNFIPKLYLYTCTHA